MPTYVHSGFAKGKISLEYAGLANPADALQFHPELKQKLDEILKEGWTYLFIETRARIVSELEMDRTYALMADGKSLLFEMRLGDEEAGREKEEGFSLPVTGMPEVTEFRINICTKSFPRAATVEMTTGMVTYLNEAFWEWQEEWRNNPTKLAQAKEVYQVARWLLDVKKMKLHNELKTERFIALSKLFETPEGKEQKGTAPQ